MTLCISRLAYTPCLLGVVFLSRIVWFIDSLIYQEKRRTSDIPVGPWKMAFERGPYEWKENISNTFLFFLYTCLLGRLYSRYTGSHWTRSTLRRCRRTKSLAERPIFTKQTLLEYPIGTSRNILLYIKLLEASSGIYLLARNGQLLTVPSPCGIL